MPIDAELLHTFLRSRRSIRRFKTDPVSEAVIRKIIHTAAFAPSAHNRQPWRFAVVTDPSVKAALADALAAEFERDLRKDKLPPGEIEDRIIKSRQRITSSPLVIVLCIDMTEMDRYPDARRSKAEYIMGTQSVANAGMQLLLAAHAEGLGGVWVCSPLFAQKAVWKALDLSKTWEPQAMFLIGYPLMTPAPKERRHLDQITKFFDPGPMGRD